MQPTTSAQALTGLQSAQAAAQDPNTILQAQQNQLGVNGAQQTVTGLRGAINNTTKLLTQVAPSVMGRTASSLVNNAQAGKQIQNEQAPLSANLNQEGTDYTNATSDLNTLEGKAQTAASGIYQGQQDKLSYAQNLYNTLYQQEQDKQAEADKTAAMAEQVRQANLAQSNLVASRSNAGPTSFSLPNAPVAAKAAPASGSGSSTLTAPTLSGGKSQQDAYNAVQALKSTKNPALINKTVLAIAKSANSGNTYDKYRIQLLQQLGF
jgi:hypothetical protein